MNFLLCSQPCIFVAANFQHMVLIGGVVKQCVVSLIDHSSLDTENSKGSDTFRVTCCEQSKKLIFKIQNPPWLAIQNRILRTDI